MIKLEELCVMDENSVLKANVPSKKGCSILSRTAMALCVAVFISGCASTRSSSPDKYANVPVHDLEKRYRANPNDYVLATAFGDSLRRAGRTEQAVAVLERVVMKKPNNKQALSVYGKTLIAMGQLNKAQSVLMQAHSPDRPDWSVLSALGSIEDQKGNQKAAQNYYIEALKIQPNEPSVLSNLGLSYILDNRLVEAEQVLRKAASHPKADEKVKANYIMVQELIRGASPEVQSAHRSSHTAQMPVQQPQRNRQMQAPRHPRTAPATARKGRASPQQYQREDHLFSPPPQTRHQGRRYDPADFY